MMRLQGPQVVLRPLRLDELDTVLAARDHLEIGAQPGRTRARQRLQRRLARSGRLTRGHLDLAVEVAGRLIGEIQARGHPAQTLPAGVFELGIVVYDLADRGKGYGMEAVALLTGWLFEQAGAARVQAGTAVGNPRHAARPGTARLCVRGRHARVHARRRRPDRLRPLRGDQERLAR